MSYERPNIQRMHGYAAGEQPRQADVIKLNTNENPYPATAAVAEALRQLTVAELRRYPPPLASEFRRIAAELHGVQEDNIIPVNGGDELLRLAVTTFVGPGEPLGVAEPSYSLYPVLADVNDSPVVRVPLSADWRLPTDFAAEMNAAGVRLAFVVNPHAPSGTLIPVADLAAIARELDGVLLIDEAYVDFVEPAEAYDAVALLQEFDNVLILRTLSKGYSLAGLRFAYGIGSTELLSPMLYKTRDSYNTDYISQKLACAALRDQNEAARGWVMVREQREHLARELDSLGFSCEASQSNFLLTRTPDALPAHALYDRLKHDGILVRYFDQERLRDKLRITIGTADENSRLLSLLRSYLSTTG